MRGAASGSLVAAVAVAAHGLAGGGVPGSAEIALLALAGLATGALAGRRLPRSPAGLITALLGGQWAGHLALSGVLGHHRGGAVLGELLHLPSATMTAAHLMATALCAGAILAAERLYLLVSSVVRAVLSAPVPPLDARRAPRTRYAATLSAFRPIGAHPPRAPPVPA
ncbi:hypothetical protein ACWEQ0_00300 [Nocardia thailandica]